VTEKGVGKLSIAIAGGGVIGLWQAFMLARAGFRVRLFEKSLIPFQFASSRWAGAMIAPECEAEGAPVIVRDLGREGLSIWRESYPDLIANGTLVIAHGRDAGELARFAKLTERHEQIASARLAELEPALAGRFSGGLYFAQEAHVEAVPALLWLMTKCQEFGAKVELQSDIEGASADIIIDCRGMGAADDLPNLRGVRGERVVIETQEVALRRPVRLLHPRQPIYVVPQGGGRFVIGASVIEREDDAGITLKSALELLGSAYALHPAFGEAAVIEMGAGVRPAFPDNVPRISVEDGGRVIRVNGAYRHGFLLAPVLAKEVLTYLSDGGRKGRLFGV
jgi:glycine oxidase